MDYDEYIRGIRPEEFSLHVARTRTLQRSATRAGLLRMSFREM